jgi:SAM-dependent methyltransferase
VSWYDSATYGERWADVYDHWTEQHLSSSAAEIDFLADRARGGRALELGIGTGRVAIPLAERGVEVVGIDASERMLASLREKTDRITIVNGEMADVPAEGEFDLVYVVFNTFFAMLTQEQQVRCFANVARRLKPDGVSSELDLMARLAGLHLRERYEDFERRPFTAASASHVSVYAA